MSYKIARVTNLYPAYIESYYRKFPLRSQDPYQKQYEDLVNDSCEIVSSYTKNLRKLGVEAFDVFTNIQSLQDKWREENGSSKSGKQLIAEQIKMLNPDVVWLDDASLFDKDWISQLRDTVKSIKLVTGHMCAPYSPANIRNLRSIDFLVTCTPCLRDEFELHGIPTMLLYHGFETSILEKIKEENPFPAHELLFTGSLYTGGGFHKTRIEFLEFMLRKNLPLEVYGNVDTLDRVLKKIAAYYVINATRKVGARKLINYMPILKHYESYGDSKINFYSKKLRSHLRPPVFGLDQFKLLSNAAISFNIHGEIAKECAGNVRLFEATGVGSCLVTDWKANLGQLFVPDSEIVTYNSKEECVDKIKWLLAHPKEREAIARAGQRRALADHSIFARAQQVNEFLLERLR